MPETYVLKIRQGKPGGGKGPLFDKELSYTLATGQDQTLFDGTQGNYIVRRLTPKECERLQGFPDDWTKVPYRGKTVDECPDGSRYKAMGNSMAVPVMRWLGERIAKVDEILQSMDSVEQQKRGRYAID